MESKELGSPKKPVTNLFLFLKQFYRDPYETIDLIDLRIPKLNVQLNIMKDDQKLLRAMILPFLIAPCVLWWITAFLMALFTPYNGFDAGLNQLSYPLTALIMGEGLEKASSYFFSEYGKGCHWSAILIYYGFFVYLSKHLRKLGLQNSLNIGFTTCFTAFTISLFEYYWMISYRIFQDQSWILGFTAPQTLIFIQNIVFFLLGALRIMNINWKLLKPNFNKWTWIFGSLSLCFLVFWWIYGLVLPVEIVQTLTDQGLWRSNLFFPQTVYTISLSPGSSTYMNSIALWICNDWLHLVNVLAKVFLTLTLLNLFLLKERKQ